MPEPATEFSHLFRWHLVESPMGDYLERFDRTLRTGLVPRWPLRFRVIRDSWDTTGRIPKRSIHAISLEFDHA